MVIKLSEKYCNPPFCQNGGQRGCQRGLAVVNVPNGADIDVRLVPLVGCFAHGNYLLFFGSCFLVFHPEGLIALVQGGLRFLENGMGVH